MQYAIGNHSLVHTCMCQGVKKVSLSENFAYVINR